VEVGTGIDLHGRDETKAAQRAVKDAISHSSMVGLSQLFYKKTIMEIDDFLMVDVNISTPNPKNIEEKAVLNILPEGKKRLTIVKGGMKFPNEATTMEAITQEIVIANAVIVVLVDMDNLDYKKLNDIQEL
jgi:uncharacterized protein (TIGR02058 family)